MTIEIDISDIPLGTFYTDERCKRIERIIQSKGEYSEFRAKRSRKEENPTLDIYIIMDATENFWVWMHEWEVDALSDSEILEYITVTKETSQRSDLTENWGILMSLFIAISLVFPFIIILVPDFPIFDFIIGIMVLSFIGSVVSGVIFKMKYDEYKESERKFEIEMMKLYPLFVESIRKFAALSDITEVQSENYRKRLQEIESKLGKE